MIHLSGIICERLIKYSKTDIHFFLIKNNVYFIYVNLKKN